MSDVLALLDGVGAVVLDRHFVYKSGKHGTGYINMDPLFPDVNAVSDLCRQLSLPFEGQFSTVASPAVGGVVLAFATACQVPGSKPWAVWADKDGDDFRFERAGFTDHLEGQRVLVVEDLLTTGGSVIKVCREAEKHGAEIIGVSVIVNRGGVTAEQLGVPRLEELASVSFDAFAPAECPQCAKGVPIVQDIGHGTSFKTEHPDYAGGYTKLLA
jgi:orotate phosphoribosyltransferase